MRKLKCNSETMSTFNQARKTKMRILPKNKIDYIMYYLSKNIKKRGEILKECKVEERIRMANQGDLDKQWRWSGNFKSSTRKSPGPDCFTTEYFSRYKANSLQYLSDYSRLSNKIKLCQTLSRGQCYFDTNTKHMKRKRQLYTLNDHRS